MRMVSVVTFGGCICGAAFGISRMWLNVVLHGVGCIGFIVVCSMLTCVVLDGFDWCHMAWLGFGLNVCCTLNVLFLVLGIRGRILFEGVIL